MFNNDVNNTYKDFINLLISKGFKCKKNKSNISYLSEKITVNFYTENIAVYHITENRRFYFDLDTSNNFLINFLSYLDNNNYNEIIV